jgi:hypothetical protein
MLFYKSKSGAEYDSLPHIPHSQDLLHRKTILVQDLLFQTAVGNPLAFL